jgi:hypothetical protein
VPFQNYCDLSDAAQRYWAMQKKVVRQSGLLSTCISLLGESEGGGSSDDMKDKIAEEKGGQERRGGEVKRLEMLDRVNARMRLKRIKVKRTINGMEEESM